MSDDSDAIGYKRPPKEHQFKPGQSGNPRGRPKGTRNFQTDLEDALAAKVTTSKSGRRVAITAQAAAIKRLVHKAVVDGDTKAIALLLTYAQQIHAAPRPDSDSRLTDQDDINLLRIGMQRFQDGRND